MIASSPGSSNSTGMRTAWFLPLRNSLTYLCSVIEPLLAYARNICRGPINFSRVGRAGLPLRRPVAARCMRADYPRARHFPGAISDRFVPFGDQDFLTASPHAKGRLEIDLAPRVRSAPATSTSGTLHNRDRV